MCLGERVDAGSSPAGGLRLRLEPPHAEIPTHSSASRLEDMFSFVPHFGEDGWAGLAFVKQALVANGGLAMLKVCLPNGLAFLLCHGLSLAASPLLHSNCGLFRSHLR